MPFNLIGATEAAPGTGTNPVAFPSDDQIARLDSNDSMKVTEQMTHLLGVFYAAESTGARCLIVQPGEINKSFLKCCLTTDNDPAQGYHDHFSYPIKLKQGSKLQAQSVNATSEDTLIGLLLGNGHLAPKPETIDEVIDGYSDTTITALTWTRCPITWNQDLKPGTYSIVGMRASVFLAANAWSALARVVIPGNATWRPGVPATIAEADHEELQSQTYEPYVFWGDMGVTFKAPENMPNIEVLSPAAHTDQNVQLMLKKVA